MDAVRYALAVFLVVVLPVVIIFWLVIHGRIVAWRLRGMVFAYSASSVAMVIVGVTAFSYRDVLLGRDLGMHWLLFITGFAIYGATWSAAPWLRKHLDLRTFFGIPELENDPTKLLQDGPFAVVRHPRYLIVIIGILGWSMMSNYAGAYLVGALSILGLLLVVRFEERELLTRFGDAYRDYQRHVPQIIPRPSRLLAPLRRR